MRHRRQAPEDHGQRVAQPCAQPVYQPAHHHHADGVSRLKGKDEIAVVDFVPSQIVLQSGLENSQDLAVHVVLGDSEEQEGADDPAEIAGARRSSRCRDFGFRWRNRVRGVGGTVHS